MHAKKAWQVAKGQAMTVAVVDSGVDPTIPELHGQVLEGWDASNNPTDPHVDDNGHGTVMAALIAGTGRNGGTRGLAPQSHILPIKMERDSKKDSPDGIASRAIRYAADHGAQVINISMGSVGDRRLLKKMQAAVNYALTKGSLIFAATGNDGSAAVGYPAALSGVVAVGAVDRSGKVAEFSNYGDEVGLVAFGVGLPQRCIKGSGFCKGNGTSQATAIASASAALIWSAHPGWTNNQVLRVMMQTAGRPKTGKMPSEYLGYGSVRPRKVLVDGEGKPGAPDENPMFPELTDSSPSPSLSATESVPTGSPSEGSRGGAPVPTSPESAGAVGSAGGSDDGTLWVAVGGGVVAAVVVAGGVLLVRRRRGAQMPQQPNVAAPPPPYRPWGGS